MGSEQLVVFGAAAERFMAAKGSLHQQNSSRGRLATRQAGVRLEATGRAPRGLPFLVLLPCTLDNIVACIETNTYRQPGPARVLVWRAPPRLHSRAGFFEAVTRQAMRSDCWSLGFRCSDSGQGLAPATPACAACCAAAGPADAACSPGISCPLRPGPAASRCDLTATNSICELSADRAAGHAAVAGDCSTQRCHGKECASCWQWHPPASALDLSAGAVSWLTRGSGSWGGAHCMPAWLGWCSLHASTAEAVPEGGQSLSFLRAGCTWQAQLGRRGDVWCRLDGAGPPQQSCSHAGMRVRQLEST